MSESLQGRLTTSNANTWVTNSYYILYSDDKTINNLPRWGRFQPNFRWLLAAKLLTGPQKSFRVKWWHGPPLSSYKNLVEIERRTSAWEDKVWCFSLVCFLVNHAEPLKGKSRGKCKATKICIAPHSTNHGSVEVWITQLLPCKL